WRRVRYLDASGVIHTLAGTGVDGTGGDKGNAAQAEFYGRIADIEIGPDGAIYVADGRAVRRISGAAAGFGAGEARVASEDGREVYRFDAAGRHLSTYDAMTGATRWSFSYDARGHLVGVSDAFGNTTVIERDASGEATAIVSPHGVRTELEISSEGQLAAVINPAGEANVFDYAEGGLLIERLDPRAGEHVYGYDPDGRLVRDDDPAGGFQTLTRTSSGNDFEVVRTTAMGRPFTASVARTGQQEARAVTRADGTSATALRGAAGNVTTTRSDGTASATQRRPDPRFGLQAPLLTTTMTTPGGRQWTGSIQRQADTTSPDFLVTPTTWSESRSSPSGQETVHYDRATSTVTTTSPEGRTVTALLGPHGETLSVQRGDLSPVEFSHDPQGRIVGVTQDDGSTTRSLALVYDAQGFVAQRIDPIGRVTQYER